MKLYAQAFFLYGSSFRYWFTREEIIHLNERNKQFETPSIEEQLISKYYALTDTDYSGTWVNAATILEKINGGIKKTTVKPENWEGDEETWLFNKKDQRYKQIPCKGVAIC